MKGRSKLWVEADTVVDCIGMEGFGHHGVCLPCKLEE